LVVATVVAAFAVLVGMLAGAVGHVRGAADLAAVSAAAAQREGRSPCAAARVVAEENQTSLRDCDTEGDLFDFAVSVTVAAPLELDVPGVPEEVVAISHAGWLTD
jgi:secretion/DNA translocation related TadE-like protein